MLDEEVNVVEFVAEADSVSTVGEGLMDIDDDNVCDAELVRLDDAVCDKDEDRVCDWDTVTDRDCVLLKE